MKTIFKLFLALTILTIFSCEEDAYIEEQIPEFDAINAGFYDNSFYHDSLENPVEISLEYTSDSIYKSGSSSFLINGLEFILRLQILANTNSNESNLTEQFTLDFPDGVDIISKSKKYNVPKDQIDFYSVKMLNFGSTIDRYASWYSLNKMNRSIDFWVELHSEGLSIGDYITSTESKYIAFRHFDKAGWIKIDMNDKFNPKVLEYVLKK